MNQLNNILFLDIETVPQYSSYEEVSDEMKAIWEKKAARIDAETLPKEVYEQKAGIYAEYGKVVAISLGFFTTNDGLEFRTKSLFSHDEKELLTQFNDILHSKFAERNIKLCAHNGKEFDFPYLCRRMIIHQMELPKALQIMGKKPWEVPHLDTLELWKFGDYKHYTSLETLTTILGIPSSKDDIDGSEVASVYYKENNLERIAHYCTNDVIATARVYLKFMRLGELADENIIRN